MSAAVLAATLTVSVLARADATTIEGAMRAVTESLGPVLERTAHATFDSHDGVGLSIETAQTLSADTAMELRSRVDAAIVHSLASVGRVIRVDRVEPGGDVSLRARQAGASRLLRVRLDLEGGELVVSASVVVVDHGPRRDFLRAVPTPPETVGEPVTVRARLDVTTLSALGVEHRPRWPTVDARPRVIPTPFHDVVALGVADLDGDRRAELIVLGERTVRVARLTDRGLVFLSNGNGTRLDVLGWNPTPSRQPWGTVGALENNTLKFRTSAMNHTGTLSLRDGAVTVTDAGATVVTEALPEGWAVRCAPSGNCTFTVPGAVSRRLSDTAGPWVVADFDGDTHFELATASASLPDAPDRVRVFTSDGTPHMTSREISTPGPITAMAAGDLDADGLPELVVSAVDPVRHAVTLLVIP